MIVSKDKLPACADVLFKGEQDFRRLVDYLQETIPYFNFNWKTMPSYNCNKKTPVISVYTKHDNDAYEDDGNTRCKGIVYTGHHVYLLPSYTPIDESNLLNQLDYGRIHCLYFIQEQGYRLSDHKPTREASTYLQMILYPGWNSSLDFPAGDQSKATLQQSFSLSYSWNSGTIRHLMSLCDIMEKYHEQNNRIKYSRTQIYQDVVKVCRHL